MPSSTPHESRLIRQMKKAAKEVESWPEWDQIKDPR